jgi:NTE family protein
MSEYNYKNLALQAGGVLGTAYVGAVKALAENGILAGIERVSGSSAGAIMGALVALRFSPAEIERIMLNLDYSSFTDGFNPFDLLQRYGLYKGDCFHEWMRDLVGKKLTKDATFEDMAKAGFGDLYIFATDITSQGLQEFSCRSTPDASVASAVRASMSIPLFFEAWQFPDGNPNDHIYVDGGMLLAYPLWTFDYPPFIAAETYNPETLGLSLKTKSASVGERNYGDFKGFVNSLFATVSSMRISATDQLRTVSIDTLGISPTNFKISMADKQKLAASGYSGVISFLKGENNCIFEAADTGELISIAVPA